MTKEPLYAAFDSKYGELKQILNGNDLEKMITESFQTVADEFGFTVENAPKFTAFATTEERLYWQLETENWPMYAFYDHGNMAGYYSLLLQENHACGNTEV